MLTLLAVICPPLAVFATGNRSGAIGNVGLTMLGYLPGLRHALGEVDRYTTIQRYQLVMDAMGR
jgi:uncharacterized membrane protein YqaE (UPF0057 family)